MKTFFLIFVLILGGLAIWGALAAASVERRFPPTGVFVPVTGGRLHLRDIAPREHSGESIPPERTIVMLHGASCNLLALTLPLAGPLGQRFRVIAIDRPGHGHSERPGGRDSASITQQAALIAEAMAAAGAPRAIVLAHSFAGAVALTLAMDHPERVAGLVLLSPASHPWPGGIDWTYHAGSIPVVDQLFSRLLLAPGATLTMEAGVKSVFAPQEPPPDYVNKTALPLLLRPQEYMANAQDVAGLYDHVLARSPGYRAIKAPTLVIAGNADKIVYTEIHTASLARELPDVTAHVLPGVGHTPHHAATDFVVSEIEALSRRVEAAGR